MDESPKDDAARPTAIIPYAGNKTAGRANHPRPRPPPSGGHEALRSGRRRTSLPAQRPLQSSPVHENPEDAIGQADNHPAGQEGGCPDEESRNRFGFFLPRSPRFRQSPHGDQAGRDCERSRAKQGEKASSRCDHFSSAGRQHAGKIHPCGVNPEDLCPGARGTQIGHQCAAAGIHEGGPDPLEDAHEQEGHAQPGKEKQGGDHHNGQIGTDRRDETSPKPIQEAASQRSGQQGTRAQQDCHEADLCGRAAPLPHRHGK